ncbi:MAG TPA: hypothetical protein VHS78_14645 [Candidatus Elarobacter sp.]|nr:hypothetical protein [Candidatus Elarobacter sp.]
MMLDEPRAASAFSRSVGKLGRFPRVIIDDAPDGERYELDRAVVIRYAHQAPSTIRVTFRFARFRLRCGPPTCAIPLTYDSAAPR